MEVTTNDVGGVVTSMLARFDRELIDLPEDELKKNLHFRWDESASIEWNIYKFSDALEMFKRSCRRWEEHHNGSCCVVERVRDKYLMPKVREFLAELVAHNVEVSGAAASSPRPARLPGSALNKELI